MPVCVGSGLKPLSASDMICSSASGLVISSGNAHMRREGSQKSEIKFRLLQWCGRITLHLNGLVALGVSLLCLFHVGSGSSRIGLHGMCSRYSSSPGVELAVLVITRISFTLWHPLNEIQTKPLRRVKSA